MAIGYDSGDTTSASNPNGDDNICIGERSRAWRFSEKLKHIKVGVEFMDIVRA